jgi:hypothetical protein
VDGHDDCGQRWSDCECFAAVRANRQASLRRDLDRRDAQLEQLHINLGFLIRDRNNIHGELFEQHVEATFKPGQPMYTRLETSVRTMADKAIEQSVNAAQLSVGAVSAKVHEQRGRLSSLMRNASDTSILARSLNAHRADMAQLQREVDDNRKQVAALPTHLGKVSAKVKSVPSGLSWRWPCITTCSRGTPMSSRSTGT